MLGKEWMIMEKQSMKKKVRRFFVFGSITVVLTCVIIFSCLTFVMSKQTEESITRIGNIYMSEMNMQLQQKFTAITDLRLEQVESIVKREEVTDTRNVQDVLNELRTGAEVRNFTYLALYTKEGIARKILGEDLEIVDYAGLLANLNENGKAVGFAKNSAGEKFLMLACTAAYKLDDGSASETLVAGVSMNYLEDALHLDEEDTMMYSHVIAGDGTFVIRNRDAFRENYFARIDAMGGGFEGETSEEFAEKLRAAIAGHESCSAIINTDGDKRYMFCSPISDGKVDWYLISAMSMSQLDNAVGELDAFRLMVMFISVAILLLVMLIIFVRYYRMSKLQLESVAKAREQAVRADMAKSEFLSSMSHDIRTPMNAIIGMTEIALKNIADTSRVKDCLEKVKLSSKHLLGLINDVLDMSKIESGKMTLNITPVSLREAMDDIVNIMQPEVKSRGQYFDIFIQKIESEIVHCDGVRLNQVLLNLLSNATKFTPEKGRIDVHLYQEESPKGREYVRTHFIVEDTGIGMSEEFQKKIFNTFEREDNEQVRSVVGTGLGTSITKSIITLMGGTIELQSEQGKGSRFHVTLDFERAEESDEIMKLPDWNVLVVDDNEALCLSAVANLSELGVKAEWTLSGAQAIELIEERHRRDEDYQFVLIDWKMPGMDGVETIGEIRKRIGKIPIFLISAYDWNDIEDKVSQEDIEGFIPKPLFKSTLFSHLKKYVDGVKEEIQNEPDAVDFHGIRMLLAEDIDLNWEIANEILSSVGLVLERAVNGLECVEKFRESEVGYYQGILMDIRMPVMDGYDATKEIRALDRPDTDLPIIAMTADAFSDDAKHCFECGMDAHLTKPLDIKDCMQTLEKFLLG